MAAFPVQHRPIRHEQTQTQQETHPSGEGGKSVIDAPVLARKDGTGGEGEGQSSGGQQGGHSPGNGPAAFSNQRVQAGQVEPGASVIPTDGTAIPNVRGANTFAVGPSLQRNHWKKFDPLSDKNGKVIRIAADSPMPDDWKAQISSGSMEANQVKHGMHRGAVERYNNRGRRRKPNGGRNIA